MTTLEELEARVAALEANQADYRAVLAAVNALGANQREIATTVRDHTARLDHIEGKVDLLATTSDDTNGRARSLEEGQAEIKDLLIRALDK
ncbi:MAG: hypothetical protein QOG95_3583 [Mycobacterium sp.]|nr:hypothetical protein [Mycobacterium sp.]